jgi:ribosome-binding factor A
MPRDFGRNKRIADLVQRELADIIQRERTDTGLQLVTISYVDVSPDLTYAKIFITCLDTNRQKVEVVEILNEFAGHFRHLLSKKLTLRSVPRIKFFYDESIERGSHISTLIDSLNLDNNEKKGV